MLDGIVDGMGVWLGIEARLVVETAAQFAIEKLAFEGAIFSADLLCFK